eukprot:365535-Chlamydomonas_euryale.AAC.43
MGGSAADLCSAIFADVQSLALTVEGLTVLREEGRKLCRFLKVRCTSFASRKGRFQDRPNPCPNFCMQRTEVLISDVAPYLPHDGDCPPEVWVPLKASITCLPCDCIWHCIIIGFQLCMYTGRDVMLLCRAAGGIRHSA